MKVKQGQPEGFTPITITLETQEEADTMWAMMNASIPDVIENSFGNLTRLGLGELVQQMWADYDEVHPTGW